MPLSIQECRMGQKLHVKIFQTKLFFRIDVGYINYPVDQRRSDHRNRVGHLDFNLLRPVNTFGDFF